MLAEKSAKQTSAWAEAAATAVPLNDLDRDNDYSVHPIDADLGDAAIAPEDAIDYKIEEARRKHAATVSAPPVAAGSLSPASNTHLPQAELGDTEPPRVPSSGAPSPQPRTILFRCLSYLASRIRRLAVGGRRST
ncbi:hypothetical protein EXIGLDRAFT_729434 [Exidia glandulosa HHB12029]|uniref:Uncharacterized protein n=1 Tax=Exidia glandulosa HHB12029 TaxID=1314781 RepID=A0A165LJ52_EXIGL|nr:hypothetical protein EXIGLDRAFT_729434 [Exidia glandulosa HHB12029]